MPIIKDSTAREWSLTITIGDVKRVRHSMNVDLLKPLDLHGGGDLPLLTAIESDLEMFCDILFALLKPQADAAGVDADSFAALLDGDVLEEFHRAFWGELERFFRGLPRGRVIVAAIERQRALVAERIEEAMQTLQTLGKSSTSLPEASESCPTP